MPKTETLFTSDQIGESEFGHSSPTSPNPILSSHEIADQNSRFSPEGQISFNFFSVEEIPIYVSSDQLDLVYNE